MALMTGLKISKNHPVTVHTEEQISNIRNDLRLFGRKKLLKVNQPDYF